MNFMDNLRNFASRLGTRSDKAAHDHYGFEAASQTDLEAAYRTSWFRKIVDIPAEDSVREWRTWQADTELQTTPIENEEARLQVRQHVLRARILARLHGGSAIFMGGLPGDPDMPVNLREVGKGNLKYLATLDRWAVSAAPLITDPMDPGFGGPAHYELTSVGATTGLQRVHPSRVIRFVGNPYPSAQTAGRDGWGDSIWYVVRNAVKNADLAAASIAAMLHEAKIDIISIPGLTENMASAEYESLLVKRFTTANVLKSTINALILDGGNGDGKGSETYETKQISFAGLPDILDRLMQVMSGAADIPATRMLGRAPQGMNATGESDMRNYYDMVRVRQDLEMTPALHQLDEVLIRSALGTRPDDIWFEWNPLYSVNEKEGADIEKIYADGLTARVNTGLFDDRVLGQAELNRMVESGRYPGIEAAITEAASADGLADPEDAEEMRRLNAEAEADEANPPEPRRLVAANDGDGE